MSVDRKEYQRLYRLRNREYFKIYDQRKKDRNKIYVNKSKEAPCDDCGLSFHPVCMAYHHRDPSTKRRAVAHLAQGWSIDTIQTEIDKCDLLCMNCHALRHEYQRFLDNHV